MAKIEDNPTVSVVIPTYNRAHLVGRAIQSVLNQTYQDFEIIVVDDGSTDNTEEVVKNFDDGRIRYIQLSKNSRTSAAPRNTAIKTAKGEYVALLDSDDEWLPEKLEKQINKFKSVSSDVGLVYCGYVFVDNKTGETSNESMPTERGDVFKLMLEELILGDTTPLVRKECFEKVGVYDTEFLSCQSWDMWIRMSKYYKFDFVPEILCKFYIHGKQNTASLERRIQGLSMITRKYQNELSKKVISYRFRRLGSFCCYQGDFKKASRYFGEAISNNPRNIQAYILFFLCKSAPMFYQARLKKQKDKSVSESGGVVIW